jgi:hypothetical protein
MLQNRTPLGQTLKNMVIDCETVDVDVRKLMHPVNKNDLA